MNLSERERLEDYYLSVDIERDFQRVPTYEERVAGHNVRWLWCVVSAPDKEVPVLQEL